MTVGKDGTFMELKQEIFDKIQRLQATGQLGGTVTTYEADGAIALTDAMAILDAGDATCAMTLAAGFAGQVIRVKAVDVSNAVTLVPAVFQDGTTITFTPADEYAVLQSDGTTWYFVGGDAAIT